MYTYSNRPNPSCPYSRTLSRMPPLSHWPDRSEKFEIINSHVLHFIKKKTNQSWSMTVKTFYEAKKNHVIIFDQDTRLWSGHLFSGQQIQTPGKPRHRHPKARAR